MIKFITTKYNEYVSNEKISKKAWNTAFLLINTTNYIKNLVYIISNTPAAP